MKHKIITVKDADNLVNVNLSVQELKMLHNAIVDILKENHEMTGYKALGEKLSKSIK